MRDIFFYTLCIAFTIGIFLRSLVPIGTSEILLLFVVAGACFIAQKLRTNRNQKASPLLLTSVALFLGALGMWRMHATLVVPSAFQMYEDKEVSLLGTIVREPDIRESVINLDIKPVGIELAHREYIRVQVDRFTGEGVGLSYGDIIRATGILTRPESFETDGGRVFDYPGYLKARGVRYTIGFAEVTVEVEESGTFFGYLFKGKHRFMEVIEDVIPEPHAGLGEGILLGVKRALGKDLEETFRETGIIHVVVLSGYNIMILVSFLMFFLTRMFFPHTRMGIGIGVIVLFAILVGPSATVVRASTMAILLLVAQSTGRRYAVLRALLCTGVVMLILNPYLLVHDPGFQLSFMATLGLILLAPYLEKKLTLVPLTVGIRTVVSATIATQIFVLPLLLYHTGMFSVVSIVVNALVLPMVSVAMLLTFASGIAGMVSSILGTIIGYFAYLSLGYIIGVAELFGALPFASFMIDTFPFFVVVVLYWIIAMLVKHLLTKGIDSFDVAIAVNDYEGWTILEEKDEERESPIKVQRISDTMKQEFPFR